MSKESPKRFTTEVFRKDAEKNLLGKEKDWCNPKNLAGIRGAEELLRKEDVNIKYDPGQYLVNNLSQLLRKTSLDDKAQTLIYYEIRSAWDTVIDDAYYSDGKDSYGFKEKKIYNLYWLSSRFNLSEKCRKLQLKDGAINFLDKDGKVILSFSLDLKSSARKIAESKEMVEACKDERKEKGKEASESVSKSLVGGNWWNSSKRIIEGAKLAKPAKSATDARSADTAEADRSERRAEESAKPAEVAKPVEIPAPNGAARLGETSGLVRTGRPIEIVAARVAEPAELVRAERLIEPAKPAEVAKPVKTPAPEGLARPAEAAGSAQPERLLEATESSGIEKSKTPVGLKELRQMGIYTTRKESHEMQQLSGQPSWWPKNAHITIDDGPRLANNSLPRILDALDKYGAKATFFFVGAQLDFERKRNPDLLRETLWRLINAGHQIGCHAYNHIYTLNTKEKVLEQIDKFQVALNKALFTERELAEGKTYKVTVGRMPGGTGTHKASTIEAFKERGIEPPKYWHIETKPWERNVQKRAGKYADALRQLDEENVPHIILLHEYPRTGGELDKMLVEFVPERDREHMLAGRDVHGAAPK